MMRSRTLSSLVGRRRYHRLPAEVEARLCTPALVIYGDVVRGNIAKVIEACGSPRRWQPHIKTVKSSWAVEALCEAGVRHFKCATSREAELLASTLARRPAAEGPFDVLVAFPHAGPTLGRVARTAAGPGRDRIRWSVLAEDGGGAVRVAAAGEAAGADLGVFLDVNCGMDRTGASLSSGGAKRVLDEVLSGAAATKLRGLHMYDGHAASLGDDLEARARALFPLYDDLLALDDRGALDLITAGTPALEASLAHAGLAESGRHRVSAGTVVLSDTRAAAQCPVGLRPAAVVASRVISTPLENQFTLDAGVKALAADCGHPMCDVLERPDFEPRIPSEEHLPVTVAPGGAMPAKGDLFYLVPKHVCPTVNLAESALLVDGGAFRELPIEARAHPLFLDEAPVAAAAA